MPKATTVSKEMYLREAGFDSLPSNWDVVQVEELLSDDRGISVGVMYPGKHDPDGIPLIKAGDLVGDTISPSPEFRVSPEKHEEYRRTEFQGGEILMTLVGNVGQCAVVPPEMKGWNAARAVAVIRLENADDAEFVRHCLLSDQLNHLMNAWANTTVQPTLNLKEIRKLPLPWPPKPERDAIASILGALDDKIELNRRMNATLESLARAIFKSWFVDFDPVHVNAGKINAGQMPASSAIPTTHDPKVLDLFPSTFQDSELGQIPEGWTIKSIEDIADVKSGKRLPKGHRLAESPTPFPYLRGVDVENGRFNPADVQYLSEETQEKISKYIVNTNDVVLTIVGTIGRVIFIDPQWNGANLTENAARITNIREGGSRLIFQYLSSPNGQDDIRSRIAGSVQGKLPLYQIKAIKLAIPNRSLSTEFERIAASIDDVLVRNLAESANLRRTRDALLPQLLSGELPVPEASTATEEILANA